ncbi:sigma factor G inhibitor Gin [Anaerobacillus sp. MEB173]|uniref:sigma factor G inhibitor Gin n=1 Tax=Anaerobacillus sp. MEB173 TaxID=3383345 RepID=UPI003F9149E7
MGIVNERTNGELCLICEELKEPSIHLFGHSICEDCERDIVKTETDDPNYQFYLKQLRKIKLSTSI